MAGYTEDIHNLFENLTCVLSNFCDEDEPERTPVKVKPKLRAKTAPVHTIHHKPDASHFLRKNQTHRRPPEIDREEYKCVLNSRRPPVPKEVSPITPRPEINFIKKNVDNTQCMKVKHPAPMVVVSCKGERRDLTNFLDARRLRQSNRFGQVPKYLIRRKKAWTWAETQYKEHMRKKKLEQDSMTSFKMVDETERATLLKGLKERWNEIHKVFQVLPVLCDTPAKRKRQLLLEKQLGALEKDIELLEANPFIYIDTSSK